LMEDSSVRCWGDNASGQLGNGTLDDSPLPVPVCEPGVVSGASVAGSPCGELLGAGVITAGGAHTCAIVASSGVACWGENSSGQVGDGTSFDRDRPVGICDPVMTAGGIPLPGCCPTPTASALAGVLPCIPVFDVVAISAGGEHTCAVTDDDGAVLCWGKNLAGQLGDGTVFDSPQPVQVCREGTATSGGGGCSALIDAATVAGGFMHTCTRMQDGGILCWGANNEGKLGDGTTEQRTVPVEVEGFPGKPTPTPTFTPSATSPVTTTPTASLTPSATPTAALATNTPTFTPTIPPTSTRTRTPTPAVLRGDANCDGVVDAVDAALILQSVAGLVSTVPCQTNADVDQDGSITALDAALVLQYSAGLLDEL
jgi:hypothetical protein